MSRQIGSIKTETLITVPITKNCVMTAQGKRYVFMEHVHPQVFDATVRRGHNRKLYNNFVRAVRKGLYNVVNIYGLDAIDIDTPQIVLVSARLSFHVVEKDSEEVCTYREIPRAI